MKKIINIAIKLFLMFTFIQYLNIYVSTFNNYVFAKKITIDYLLSFDFFIRFVVIWCIYFVIIIIAWIKSDNISNAVIGNNNLEDIQLTLTYENILLIGINILCIYFIIDSIPMLFFYISLLATDFFMFPDYFFENNYYIRGILDTIMILLKIILSFLVIKYKEKIIKIIK
jgi:hypothetical protein